MVNDVVFLVYLMYLYDIEIKIICFTFELVHPPA